MSFKPLNGDRVASTGNSDLLHYQTILEKAANIRRSLQSANGENNLGFGCSSFTPESVSRENSCPGNVNASLDDKQNSNSNDHTSNTNNNNSDNNHSDNNHSDNILRKKSSTDGKPDIVKCSKHVVLKEQPSDQVDKVEAEERTHSHDNNENIPQVEDTVTGRKRTNSGDSLNIVPMTEIEYNPDTGDQHWRLSIEDFTSKRLGSKRKSKDISKAARSFYKSQDSLIDAFKETRLDRNDSEVNIEMSVETLRKKASFFAKITFLCNVVLLAIKVVAVAMSGSISLISSLVDSAVDLISGLVIWVTTRAVKKRDPYLYPQGRTKLEPLAIIVLSVIMAVASLQLVKESVAKIIGLADSSQMPPIMNFVTIGIASATVVTKLGLFLVCRRVYHPTIQALAQDHRNDVLSNTAAIVFGYLGSTQMQGAVNAPQLVYIDPVGAILICLYIAVNWVFTGMEQTKLLTGHTAPPEFISKITWLTMDHHSEIREVETVRAFHFGNNFLVEVDVVLPAEMTVRDAHDIGEELQQKLERLPNVERAFVHIDYDSIHKPSDEHKVV